MLVVATIRIAAVRSFYMQHRTTVTIHILQLDFGAFSRSFSFQFVASFSMTLLFSRYVDNIIMLLLAAATYGVVATLLCHTCVCAIYLHKCSRVIVFLWNFIGVCVAFVYLPDLEV